jgi:hypothetical protein
VELVLTAGVANKFRRIGWVSLQPDGSVSIGLNDRTFVSPDFKAQNFVWSAYNRETLQYLVTSDPASLTAIRNPHLSFHPPHWFHLKASGGKTLFEGIADLSIMLQQDGVVPWVRFISRPVSDLSAAGPPRKPDRIRFLQVHPEIEQCSIGLAVDFRRTDVPAPTEPALLSELVPWQGYALHVHAVSHPPQVATLSWFHQH